MQEDVSMLCASNMFLRVVVPTKDIDASVPYIDGHDIFDINKAWEYRWIVLHNGIVRWYTTEFDSFPEGFARILTQAASTGRTLENGECIITVEAECQNIVTVLELGISSSCLSYFQTIIDNSNIIDDELWQVQKDLLTKEMEDLAKIEKESTSQLVLHVKGDAHPVPVHFNEDIDVATEKVLSSFKLKPEMRPKIETELLRTKVDACHLLEARLKQRLTILQRQSSLLVVAEKAAALANNHSSNLEAAYKQVDYLLPEIESTVKKAMSKVKTLENRVEELTDQLALERLDSEHVKESAVQLSAQLLDRENVIEKLQSEISALKQKLAEAPTLQTSDLAPSEEQRNSASEREKKLAAEVKELRHQKAQLTKSLENAEDQVRVVSHELITLRGKRAAKRRNGDFTEVDSVHSDEDNPQVLHDQIFKLENKIRSLRHQLALSEESNSSLKVQAENTTENLHHALAALKRCEVALASTTAELNECKAALAVENIQATQLENKRLKEQCIDMRGELLRLQAHIEEVKSTAMQAIQELQAAGPQVNVGDLMSRVKASNQAQAQFDDSMFNVTSVRGNDFGEASMGLGGAGAGVGAGPAAGGGNGAFNVSFADVGEDDDDDDNPIIELSYSPTPQNYSQHQQQQQLLQQSNRKQNLQPIATQRHFGADSYDNSFISNSNLNQSNLNQSSVDSSHLANDVGTLSAVDMLAASQLSPLVQERLFQNIFDKYLSDNTSTMNLTRFGRFAKEYGIVVPANTSNSSSNASNRSASKTHSSSTNSSSGASLVSGEVDIIFKNCIKLNVPADRVLNIENSFQNPRNNAISNSSKSAPKPFVVPKGQKAIIAKAGSKQGSALVANPIQALTLGQFVVAIEQLACKVYAELIASQTGTTLDCLPPKQRELASKAALEVFMKKKLIPIANKQGLIPWALIYVDEAVSVLLQSLSMPPPSPPASASFALTAAGTLESHVSLVVTWFKHFAALTIGRTNQDGSIDTYTFDEFELASYGISYHWLTVFAQDFGIIPYLLKETSFFELYQEVASWTKQPHHKFQLLSSLPPTLQELPLIAMGDLSSGQMSLDEFDSPVRQVPVQPSGDGLGLGGFTYLLLSVATQAFPDIDPQDRLMKLFQWLLHSGGSFLMEKQLHS